MRFILGKKTITQMKTIDELSPKVRMRTLLILKNNESKR